MGGRIYVLIFALEVEYPPRPFGHHATTLGLTRARTLDRHNDLAVLNDFTTIQVPCY